MSRYALIPLLLVLGCGNETPANVAGNYTIALTVKEVGCQILGGQVGDSSTGVQIVITQTGSQASAKVSGVAGLALGLSMGTDTFTGSVAGNNLDLSINGTMAGSSGTCAYTRNAHLQAKLSGDVLVGTVTYTYATNRTSDCASLSTCQDVQAFNGTRPPS